MYDPETVGIVTQVLTIFFATVFTVAWIMGSLGVGEESQSSSRNSLLSHFEDDEDMYAILTGDQEYLAAHVTLKEKPLPKPKPKPKPKPRPENKPKKKMRISNRAKSSRIVLREEPKPKPVKPSKTDFGSQCATALANLGCKKSEANRTVDDILSRNPDIKDIERFITEAFKKCN